MVIIMLNLLLDILIYNYTFYKSCFFLLNINDKSLIYNLFIALIIDLFILKTFFYTTIYILLIYFLKMQLNINYHNFFAFYLFNIGIILIYLLIPMVVGNFKVGIIINAFIINSVYILISYKKSENYIKLIG